MDGRGMDVVINIFFVKKWMDVGWTWFSMQTFSEKLNFENFLISIKIDQSACF